VAVSRTIAPSHSRQNAKVSAGSSEILTMVLEKLQPTTAIRMAMEPVVETRSRNGFRTGTWPFWQRAPPGTQASGRRVIGSVRGGAPTLDALAVGFGPAVALAASGVASRT